MFVFFRKEVVNVVLSKIMKEQDDILCRQNSKPVQSLLWCLGNKKGISTKHFALINTVSSWHY